jgi:iron complex outermembrane recepter protein
MSAGFLRSLLSYSSLSCLLLTTYSVQASSQSEDAAASQAPAVEEILIWGQQLGQRSDLSHPASVLTQADLLSINIATTEDIVKYEPSLVIRRRFIGDSNGTMGMRGANMFQTSRSMVFADGVPLHYLLQSRWNGSPRWTLVSASEIAQVEVLYGPFSALYSGNSMGGVVNIESAIPQEREFRFDSSFFSQDFGAYGFDDRLNGYKTFFSVGDKIGDLSLYFSFNRLENDAQPQTFYNGAPSSAPTATAISGGVAGNDQMGVNRLWLGDTGVVNTETNNYKIKLGYDFNQWSALLNLAYEDRFSDNAPTSYMQAADGRTIWGGTVNQDGRTVSIPASRFSVGAQDRDSLSTGLRLRGPVLENSELEINLNHFTILRDESRNSQRHPLDPAHTPTGQVTDFSDTGWSGAELKLVSSLGTTGNLTLTTGLRHDSYQMDIAVYSSDDYQSGLKSAISSRSGGETSLQAAFAQLNWMPHEQWDVQLGARQEWFRSHNGFFSSGRGAGLTLNSVPEQKRSSFSPKLSVAYQASDRWTLSYAAARAYRYPIVEELFSQYRAYNAINQSNPELRPEDGLHHNLGIEYGIVGGYIRVNVFQESINDVIESQAETLPGGLSVRTFVPIDQVDTLGTEFIVNVSGLLNDRLDVRFNVTYTDNEIVENRVDPGIKGNVYPRMPTWRGNLMATYRINSQLDIGLNHQYADSSFGRNDNRDLERGVFGAQDGYSRTGIKGNYRLQNGFTFSAGVDNIANDIDYVAHPWPGRTLYLNVSYDW